MSESPEGSSPREMGSAALGAALAVILGGATRSLAPVTAALATPLTTRMMELIFSELGRKSDTVMAESVQASGLGPDEFCGVLAGDPALMGLAQRILWAASISGNEGKLRVLGGLLGGAVASRGDKLDETGLIVAALADIDVPHTMVLEVLTRPAPDEDGQKRQTAGALSGGYSIPPKRSGTDLMTWEPGAWLPEQIRYELPLLPGFVLACLSVLTRHGLAQTVGTYGGGQRFKITDFGQAMLEAMGRPDGAGKGDSGPRATL